jgi:hypothetical protein
MISFVDFFEGNHANAKKAAKIIDETFYRLKETTSDLDRQMPATSYEDADILIYKMNQGRPTLASVVAAEAEIPIQRSRMELSSERTSELKVGKQIVWKENDYKMLQKLRMLGNQNPAVTKAIEQAFFQTGANLVPSLYEKATMLAMKIAITGACLYTDPLSGLQVELDYSDLTVSSLMPAALTGGARWSQAATANGLRDLEQHARAFFDLYGYYRKELTMREPMLRMLANQVSVKQAYLAKNGASQIDTTATDNLYLEDMAVIDLIKQRAKVDTVTLVDVQYTEELSDGSTRDDYFLPDNYYYFSENGFIERAWVPTVEKNFQPGIYTKTKELNDAPKVERTVAVGAFVPVCFEPRKLAARKVV